MRRDTLRKFKKIFEAQKDQYLRAGQIIREDFAISPEDRYDEVDLAATDIEQSMRMRLQNRQTLFIKKIDEALRRIDAGTFGECDECGEDIELRRLEARPTATLCVACKEEQERKEVLTAVGRAHKSLGATFSRKFA